MLGILILSYRHKEVMDSYVLTLFLQGMSTTPHLDCPIEMGFESKCNILYGQVIYIEKSKVNIANMWLIPLDSVTIGIWGAV